MITLLPEVFIASFLINLPWELIHSKLYATCLKAQLRERIPMVVWASLKDGCWIALFFLISAYILGDTNIMANTPQMLFFVFSALAFTFADEKISLKMKRWGISRANAKSPWCRNNSTAQAGGNRYTGLLFLFLA